MQVKLKHCDGEMCNGKLQPIWKREGKLLYCKNCWQQIMSGEKIVPIKRTPIKKSTKPIPKESTKRQKEHKLYSVMRVQYLKDHPICEMAIPGVCRGKANEIQHLKGRGKYYLDLRYWMSACHECHSYTTDHPAEAIENGWALERLTKDK